ncbi:hypothetical protein ACFPM0_33770 [Pseudonocardia sulfidoxydans]
MPPTQSDVTGLSQPAVWGTRRRNRRSGVGRACVAWIQLWPQRRWA